MKIVHVFRAPIGGLFRHVRDLARGQNESGHQVGIVCDSTTGGEYADDLLKQLEPHCALGIERHPISRMPGLGDLAGARAVLQSAKRMKPEILHGHGAKGGAYARLAAWKIKCRSFYTPHGGSLHHSATFPMNHVIIQTERVLNRIGTGVCFVCEYEKQRFENMVGLSGKPSVVVHNGIWDDEFVTPTPRADASDFLFVGEMRDFKGVDILLNALARIKNATLTAVGDGPELHTYQQLASTLGLGQRVTFAGRMPMSEAVTRGRIMVLPSRFESFPYVVLETAASGLPMITTAVGGIAEVVPKDSLCIPLDVETLAGQMQALLSSAALRKSRGGQYSAHIRKTCSAPDMTRKITDFYRQA